MKWRFSAEANSRSMCRKKRFTKKQAKPSPEPVMGATAPNNQNADPQTEAGERRHDHSFVSKCKNIALECGLTPRELEVLIILRKATPSRAFRKNW